MKKFNKYLVITSLIVISMLGLSGQVMAATTPSLGVAVTFGILASTYTNTAIGTTINGDLGYTTPPALAPTVSGSTHAADATYAQAGIDQGTALTALAAEPCTFTFANGAIDLAIDTTHGPIGVYTPGVYCTGASSAASIGAGGITLNGAGTYIFRITGALTTVANSVVTLAGGASACDLFWTPTAATTLGANSTFAGTDIDASGITIGSTVGWVGRALAFGGTVSTSADTITVPSGCTAAVTSGGSSGGSSASTTIPKLPNTGVGPENGGIPWSVVALVGVLATLILYVVRSKATQSMIARTKLGRRRK